MKKHEKLEESLQMSLFGKIFVGTLAAWMLGKAVNTRLRGTREQIQAVVAALSASKRFQDELNKPGADVESVIQKLGIKHMTASQFERVLGIPWPL